jgi:WD40 repeat protein
MPWSGEVRAWSLPGGGGGGGEAVLTYDHGAPALSVAWEGGGATLFSGGADGTVRSVDMGTGSLGVAGEHGAPVSCVRTESSGGGELRSCVLSASWDKSLVCWDLRTRAKAGAIA